MKKDKLFGADDRSDLPPFVFVNCSEVIIIGICNDIWLQSLVQREMMIEKEC